MDYGTLLTFYLACVEEEDRRSKRLKAEPINVQYIAPGTDAGALFRDADSLSWAVSNEERKFLERFAGEIEGPRYLYGYPVWRDASGHLLPLFMAEVELKWDEQREHALLRIVHPGSIQVNLHLFAATHPSLQEQLSLQDELESNEFGTFDARLQRALEQRDEGHRAFEELVTPPRFEGWKNRSLVFRDTGGVFTHQLRSELGELRNRDLAREAAETALGTLLGSVKQGRTLVGPPELLEIVPLNSSQRAAARAALLDKLTVITGPPGTGKSQVVIDLLVSMAAAGRPVLFASKNNRAVDVVCEKIGDILGADDWTLRLGSKKKIDEERQLRIKQAVDLVRDRPMTVVEECAKLSQHIARRDAMEGGAASAALAIGRYAEGLAVLRKSVTQLPEIWREWWDREVPCNWPDPKYEHEVRKRLDDVRALSSGHWPGVWLWILRLFLGPRLRHRYQDDLRRLSVGVPPTVPEWRCGRREGWDGLLEDYETLHHLHECRRATDGAERMLSDLERTRLASEFKDELEECSAVIEECARNVCRARVRNRVMGAGERLPTLLNSYFELTERAANPRPQVATQIQRDFSRAAHGLLNVIPAVVVTSLAARRSLPSERAMFDCVIIDEASQCDIASALPLLLRAKRAVVIGDPQQLRHVSSIDDQKEQQLAHSAGADHLLSRYSYRKKSLFDCAAETQEEAEQMPFFLAEHYRSQPEIIEFSNRTYYRPNYKAGLIIRTPLENTTDAPILWHDVPSQVDRPKGSLRNETEAREVVDLATRIVTQGSLRDGWTMGIVTPYRRQRNRIESLLQEKGLLDRLRSRLRIGTVHTFQGSEADIMIFSPVVAEGTDCNAAEWISNEEGLLNVALTRARKVLHIVGDKAYCAQTRGDLGKLAMFVDELRGRKHNPPEESQARRIVRQILADMSTDRPVWYQEEWPEGGHRLDFLLVGLSGVRYDIEIDGRQHYFSAEAIAEDDARDESLRSSGYTVIRFRAVTVERHPETVRVVLSRLA